MDVHNHGRDLPRGVHLLRDPHLNKSTAFADAEREALGLIGLVPEGVDTEETQLRRVHLQLSHKSTNLDKYIYLSALQDNDETLYYKTLMSDPAQNARSPAPVSTSTRTPWSADRP